jgi:KaiC/GvpD/RAD55 family RecA-like ATPase
VYEFDKPARGRVTIADGVVRVEIELGEELRVAKSTIERRVHSELERLLKG